MNSFTEKQIQAAGDALHLENTDLLIEKLNQYRFEPANGQAISIKIRKGYYPNIKEYEKIIIWESIFESHGYIQRPLTTKEAGFECMQHLIDALDYLKESFTTYNYSNPEFLQYVDCLDQVLKKHEEKMK